MTKYCDYIMSIKFQTRAILRAAPPIIIVASILAFVITGQTLALRFIGYYLVTELLAKELKGIMTILRYIVQKELGVAQDVVHLLNVIAFV